MPCGRCAPWPWLNQFLDVRRQRARRWVQGPQHSKSPVSQARPQMFFPPQSGECVSWESSRRSKAQRGRIKLMLPSWVLDSGHSGLRPVGPGLLWQLLLLSSSYPGRIPAAHTRLGLCRGQGDSGLVSSPGTPGRWPLASLVSEASLPPRLVIGPLLSPCVPSFLASSLTHQGPRVGIGEEEGRGTRDEARTGQGRRDLSCRAALLMALQPHIVDR